MFELFILAFFLSIIVGIVASSRGRDGFGWFLLSLIISPLLSILLLLCTTNLKTETVRKTQHEELLQALRAAGVVPNAINMPSAIHATYAEVPPINNPNTPINNPDTTQGWLIVFGLTAGLIGFIWLLLTMAH